MGLRTRGVRMNRQGKPGRREQPPLELLPKGNPGQPRWGKRKQTMTQRRQSGKPPSGTLWGRATMEISRNRKMWRAAAKVAMSPEMAQVLKHWLLRLSAAVILGDVMSALRH